MAKISELMFQIFESYKLAFIFFTIALPLAMIPIMAEAIQHYVEFKLGMFSLREGDALTDKKQAVRLGFGFVKVLALLSITFILPRFFLHGHNQRRALSFVSGNIPGLLCAFILILILLFWVFMIGPAVFSFLMPALSEGKILLLSFGVLFIPGLYFMKPTNNLIASLWGLPLPTAPQHKAMYNALYGLGFFIQFFAVIFPTMVLHYWLGYTAMGATGMTLAAILIVDSGVVGVLACLMASCVFVLIRDAYQSGSTHVSDTVK